MKETTPVFLRFFPMVSRQCGHWRPSENTRKTSVSQTWQLRFHMIWKLNSIVCILTRVLKMVCMFMRPDLNRHPATYSHCKKSNLEELLFWVYISAIKHGLLRTNGGIWTYRFSFDLFLALTSNIGYATIVPRIFGHLTQYFWFRGKSSLVIVYTPIY